MKSYLKDFLSHKSHGKRMIAELAEEYAESCGEPQDAICLIEDFKKGELDQCFQEYVDEAYDEYERVLTSTEFNIWVSDVHARDIEDWCNGEMPVHDDNHEDQLEYYLEENGIDTVYEFINRK